MNNFQITSFKRDFFEEININNHKPKSFLRLVEGAHKDSAANRGNIFPLGYEFPPLTGNLPVSEQVPNYIIQMMFFRRDTYKQS